MAKKVKPPVCGSCARGSVRLTDGREIYPHRPDLHEKPIWKCDGCGGYVGCHPGSQRALGTPADAALRKARMILHDQLIDPLWMKADKCGLYTPEDDTARWTIRKAARGRVYGFLADKLGLTRKQCHTGMFDIETCRCAWTALRGVSYPDIRAWHQARKQSEAA